MNETTTPSLALQEAIAADKFKKRKYLSLKQMSEQTGIPVGHLRIVKNQYPDGFTKTEIHAEKVLKYYEDNKEKIVALQDKSKEELQKEKLSNDIVLQKIEIAEAKKESVSVKEVESFMTNFGIQLGALLKNRLIKELPPRITGLKEEAVTALCKEYYNEIVKVLSKNIDDWNKINE